MTIPVSVYDTIYARFSESATLKAIWRSVYGKEYPEEAGTPYSFVTMTELNQIISSLAVNTKDRIVDIACGEGDLSLWVAQQANVSVTGIDYSQVAIQSAIKKAKKKRLQNCVFIQADAAATKLPDASFDGGMSIDALQLMPDPIAVLVEVGRILKPSAVFAFTTWCIRKLPISGRTIVPDYRPLLEQAGFQVEMYNEPSNWRQRQEAVHSQMIFHAEALKQELGENASAILLDDAIQKPHQLLDWTRVIVVARNHGTTKT